MTEDEKYMHRCIQLAKNGKLTTVPNPMVGAVIVYDDRIIGEGYHIRHGEGHAEVNAFASVKKEDEKFLKESTIYVSLEPCSHYGKTPPCADLIVRKGVKRVVVGCQDPNEKVLGKGIKKIIDAGIEVEVGILEKECKELNKVFFTFHSLQRPFISMKWAESNDGFIGGIDSKAKPTTAHISNEYTQMLCHKLRAEHQAILVGRTTFDTDNPSLTTRHWPGKNPVRILLTHRDLSESAINREINKGQESEPLDFTIMNGDLHQIMKELHEMNIQSLLVEGGSNVLQEFIDADLWDEIYIEKGIENLGNGTKAPNVPQLKIEHKETMVFGGHVLTRLIKNQ